MTRSTTDICYDARLASYKLALANTTDKNNILYKIADNIEKNIDNILSENLLDINNADYLGSAMQDRLRLTKERILSMAEGVRQVANLPDPVGKIVDNWTRPNGLHITKVKAPLGVVGVIYEARPNVTIDVASLCIKSGNCVVLRGGKEAINSNRILYQIIANSLSELGFDSNVVGFIDDTTRQGTLELLQENENVDVIIPRGGNGLKNFVLSNSLIPVIASAGGNCHLFVDETAEIDMATKVVYNAKMQRPSVCNALEQLIVHSKIADAFLPQMVKMLSENGCKVVGSERAVNIVPSITLASPEDFKKEHLDYEIAIQIVDSCEEAIDIINANNTKHSDGIISKTDKNIYMFSRKVDTGCVYINASTRFTDGFEFGFGAEIGISTQKLHARGPLGLEQLTSEKYVINGQGQIRE